MEKNVLTLYYHRVYDYESDCNQLCVSPIKFRQQMLYLKYHYQFVRFEDDWNQLDSNAVCVTFDDGTFDNLEYALPILEELEVPATIFISTGTMDQTKELWWDELEYLIFIGDSIPSYFRLDDDEFGCQWNTSTWEYRRNCYYSLIYLMNNFINPAKRDKWIEQLWNWRKLDRKPRKCNMTLSCDDVKKLNESKMISIGAHTVSHPSLASLDKKLQEYEIESSINSLSDIINEKITLFSYPFGTPDIDFDEDTIEICRRCGIIKAASTENALWHPKTNQYHIPRKVIRDWTMGEFERMIKSYWED